MLRPEGYWVIWMPRVLAIDIETYSNAALRDVGVYRYADDPSFEILLFAYAFDDDFLS